MLAMNERASKGRRLEALAAHYMNDYGHATIPAGEAEEVLFGKSDDNSRRQVRRLLGQLRDAGIFAKPSTRLCIVLPSEYIQRGTGRAKTCSEWAHAGHQHHRWYRDDWEYVDYETGELQDPGHNLSAPRTESVRPQAADQGERGIALESLGDRGRRPLLTGPGTHRTSRRHRRRRMTTR